MILMNTIQNIFISFILYSFHSNIYASIISFHIYVHKCFQNYNQIHAEKIMKIFPISTFNSKQIKERERKPKNYNIFRISFKAEMQTDK